MGGREKGLALVAVAMLVVGIGVAVIQPGDLGDDDPPPAVEEPIELPDEPVEPEEPEELDEPVDPGDLEEPAPPGPLPVTNGDHDDGAS